MYAFWRAGASATAAAACLLGHHYRYQQRLHASAEICCGNIALMARPRACGHVHVHKVTENKCWSGLVQLDSIRSHGKRHASGLCFQSWCCLLLNCCVANVGSLEHACAWACAQAEMASASLSYMRPMWLVFEHMAVLQSWLHANMQMSCACIVAAILMPAWWLAKTSVAWKLMICRSRLPSSKL